MKYKILINASLLILLVIVGCDTAVTEPMATDEAVASKSSPVSTADNHIDPHFCITDAITSLQDFGDPGIAPENQWLAFYVKAPEIRKYDQSRLLAVSGVERVCLQEIDADP